MSQWMGQAGFMLHSNTAFEHSNTGVGGTVINSVVVPGVGEVVGAVVATVVGTVVGTVVVTVGVTVSRV